MLKCSDVTSWFERTPVAIQAAVIVVIGMAFLILRNTDPLVNPIIYTEDGAWTGLALTKGWLHAFINAKESYFVWGNILLLWASVEASNIFCGNALVCLPETIAFWSYLFFAGVGALAWFVTRRILPIYARWFLFLFVLLLPLGNSANEIIGRISNIGYYCVFITLILMFWKVQRTAHQVTIDLALLLCAATNPVSLVLIPLLSLFSVWPLAGSVIKVLRNWWKQYALVFGGTLLLVIFTAVRTLDAKGSSVTGSLQPENLIEVAIARSLLYPFVFPIYNQLSDIFVLLLSTALVAILVHLLRLQHDRDTKILVAMTIVALVIFHVSTMYTRQSLTQQLGDYTTTFPDRYFMGLNILVVFMVTILAGSQSWVCQYKRPIGVVVLAGLVAMYCVNSGWLFEREAARMKIASGSTFREELCVSELFEQQFKDSTVSVPIYFDGWSMVVPTRVWMDAVQRLDCSRAWDNFYLTDANWIRGIARAWAGFFVPNAKRFRDEYRVGRFVEFANGESRQIIRTNPSGVYLIIYLNGGPLPPEKVGLPAKFVVTDTAVTEKGEK